MCGSILSSFHTLQRSEPEQLSLLGHEGAKKLKQAEQEGEGKSTGLWGLLGTGVESSLSPFYPCALAGQPQWQSFRNEPDALPATTLCSCSTPEVLGDAWRRFCLPQLGEGLLLASSRQRSRTLLNIPQCPGQPHCPNR